ncbi:helix-turn-helix domain-containing protein [Nocardia sp. IFM 10818]
MTNDGVTPVDAAVWERPDMRAALAAHDLKTVYRLLGARGISQHEIARRTGQAQSEIYDVLHRRRCVQSYTVLSRIADGLGIPRGYMGLARDPLTTALWKPGLETVPVPPDDGDLLAHAAAVTATVGLGAPGDDSSWWQPFDDEPTPAPTHIDHHDVAHLTGFTAAMRAVDYKSGGGECRDAVNARLRRAQALLLADASDDTKQALYIALADLHNLAGWTSTDVGLYPAARRHFRRALDMAARGHSHSLLANILYRTGRLYLHCGTSRSDATTIRTALRFFQLGQLAAQNSGCRVTVALLCANIAWAHALLGDRHHMLQFIGRAEDEHARGLGGDTQNWVRFFGTADLAASIGVALTAQPDPAPADLARAIEHLADAVAARGPDMTRSRAFELSALATAYLREGSPDRGLDTGLAAVAAAASVWSVRTLDRLTPIKALTVHYRGHGDLHDLAHRIDQCQGIA